MDISNDLTWSFSRDRLFRECRRAYYYNYYASWGGWDPQSEEPARKAYILKYIKNMDAWVGDIVHHAIKSIIEGIPAGKDISLEEALTFTKQALKGTWEQSRMQRWKENIKNNLNLFEHYYRIELSRDQIADKVGKAAESIRNLYASGLLEGFNRLHAGDFLSIDTFDNFIFEGVRVFAIPDLVVHSGSAYVLYDWKTGKPSPEDIMQLSFYVLYAMQKWDAAFSQITIMPVYLTRTESPSEPVAPVSCDVMTAYLRESISAMRAVLFENDATRADMIHCPKTENVQRCLFCRFKEICVSSE